MSTHLALDDTILTTCPAQDPTGQGCLLRLDHDGEHYTTRGKSAWMWRR